jgi:arylsulfatase A-like enzyme/cytochrome c-type biogenesis protein CcmH/NrfG
VPLTGLLLAASLAAASSPPRPNVLIVCFDALRGDRVGAGKMPRLDAAAKDGFVFTQAVAQAPWTLPSMMSAFTSLYPHQHTVLNKFVAFDENEKEIARLPGRFVTLAQLFRANGYDTAAFTGDAGVEGRFGFAKGFDVYFDSITFGGFGTTFPQSLHWLRTRGDRPFFLFVHGYDAHGQFPAEAGEARRREEFLELRLKEIKGEPLLAGDAKAWRDWYDARAARADALFGGFWESFRALPSARRTIVVFMADHGDELLEHGGLDHGLKLYDEVLRVPLIIKDPSARGRSIAEQVRLVDLMPTLVELAGLEAPRDALRQMQGASLVPLMRGATTALDAFSETSFLLHAEKRSLRTADGWKLVYDAADFSTALYDLRADPAETRDLSRREPERTKTLTQRLLAINDAPAPGPGGESSAESAELDKAEGLFRAGRRAEAIALYEAALKAAPASTFVRLKLAAAYRLERRFSEAVRLYKEVHELAPQNSEAYIQEGYARLDLGQADEAVNGLKAAVARKPEDPALRHHLGGVLSKLGRHEEAAAEFEAAAKMLKAAGPVGGDYTHALNLLGKEYGSVGRHAEALATFGAALKAASPRTIQWTEAVAGSAEQLRRLGRADEGLAFLKSRLDGCRGGGCRQIDRAQLEALIAAAAGPAFAKRGFVKVPLELSRIEATPDADGGDCQDRLWLLDSLGRYYEAQGSAAGRDGERVEKAALRQIGCEPRGRRAVAILIRSGDRLRAAGDKKRAEERYCRAWRAAEGDMVPLARAKLDALGNGAAACGNDTMKP